MLISPAYAQSVLGPDAASNLMQFLPFVLIIVVFYFFLLRPQQTKAKQQRAMLDALRRGDRVVTGGGIIGTVGKVVSDQELAIDIAEGVRVRVMRSTITTVLAKTEPVPSKESKDNRDDPPAASTDGEAVEKEAKRKGGLGALDGLRRLIGGK